MYEVSLNELFNNLGCDKGSNEFKGRPPHNYHLLYQPDMEPKKNEKINILEIGILRGKSIEAFIKYFPNAEIYGIDTFKRISASQINILSHKRVHYISGDSTSKNISNQIKEAWPDIKFDFIIDDGLHTPDANRYTFLNLIDFLKDDGIYYVEDAWPLHIMTEEEINKTELRSLSATTFTKEKFKQFLKTIELYNYTEHDFRNITDRFAGNSFIFRIMKQ